MSGKGNGRAVMRGRFVFCFSTLERVWVGTAQTAAIAPFANTIFQYPRAGLGGNGFSTQTLQAMSQFYISVPSSGFGWERPVTKVARQNLTVYFSTLERVWVGTAKAPSW